VVLYALEKMRRSMVYQEAINKENIENLVNKYHVSGSVGDQVIFLNLKYSGFG
jgi:hypothetical protein